MNFASTGGDAHLARAAALARRLVLAALPHALLALAIAALVFWRAADGSWPHTHEGFRYILLGEHFRAALENGQLWPRWLPDINGGYGYPTFVFYQALFFFLYVPMRWLAGNPVAGMWLAVGVSLLVGASGSYRLCSRSGSRLFGLFGGFLFLLTPYVYVEWLMRGDLSELLALCLCPWVLAFLREALEAGGARPLVGFSVATAAVLLAHPITGLLLAPAVLVIAAAGTLGDWPVRWSLLARIAVAGVAAIGLSAPYWHPLVSLRESVNLHAAFGDYFDPVKHTVHWFQLFGGPWGFAGSAADSAADGMSFQLGPLQLAAALTGAVMGWKSPFIRGAALALLLSLVMMTPSLSKIWTWPVLKDMQFPWRMLSVTAGLQVALAAGWAPRLAFLDMPAGRGRLALLLGVTLLAAGWRPEQFSLRDRKPAARAEVARQLEGATRSAETFAARNEFLPRTARKPPGLPRGDRPLLETSPAAPIRLLDRHNAHHLRAELPVSQPLVVIVNQLYFPGWKVSVDGEAVSRSVLEAALQDDGRIRVPLSPVPGSPRRRLEARYDSPPGAAVRWGGVLLGIALLAALLVADRRRRRRVLAPTLDDHGGGREGSLAPPSPSSAGENQLQL